MCVRTYRRLLALLLALVLMVGMAPAVLATDSPFEDISPSAYYYDAVLWAVEQGVTAGKSPTAFAPDENCTRGQVVTFLWRASGCPVPQSAANPFWDINTDAYYYQAVLWAVEMGITTGTSADTFSPDATCSRSQVVTFLWRAAGKPCPEATTHSFKDVDGGAFYYDAMLWAVGTGITTGTSADAFSPDGDCTRGQVVTFLYRSVNGGEKPAVPSTIEIQFMDVGQADAALIACDGHYMLIDGGNKADSSKLYAVLSRKNITCLDLVVGTHAHEDHIGGLPGALRYAAAKTVLCPVKSYDSDAFRDFARYADSCGGIQVPAAGDTYALGSAVVTILGLNCGSGTNNTSIVLRIDHGETSFLFTGDAERETEAILLEQGKNLSATVLKVGHHGSDTSTSYPFLWAVNPQYAVISAGEGNSYGHPEEAVLSRLRDADVKLFRTDLQGDIFCTGDGRQVQFTVSRNENADVFGGIGDNSTQTPAPTATPAPPATPVPTPPPTAEPSPTPEVPQVQMVWIPKSGTKYHSYAGCSNMKSPGSIPITQAVEQGYTPCKKCW